jgi:hypothetical protein
MIWVLFGGGGSVGVGWLSVEACSWLMKRPSPRTNPASPISRPIHQPASRPYLVVPLPLVQHPHHADRPHVEEGEGGDLRELGA